MQALLFLLLGLLGGCAVTPPVAPHGLGQPAAPALLPSPELPPIPADEGNKAARAAYYATTRPLYAQCRADKGALIAYVHIVADPKTLVVDSRPEATAGKR